METEEHRTPIQSFYAGQSIFITGGTGFLGNTLTEKLLRSCPDISMIYLLIRSKKNTCPESRLNEMFEKPLYDRLKKEVPNFRKKVVPIVGDLNIKDFGLLESDKNMLINEVSIIFHVAANVRFHEKIKIATMINVNATATILKLAKQMPNLKAFVHVSTAYANCHVNHIEERFYSYPINHQDLIMFTQNLPENIIKKKISRVISQWPNTYTFTKAIAEGFLKNESEDLPVGIFRPGIVICSANEPLAGWIDNYYGPIGFTVYLLRGYTRIFCCNGDLNANLVPVDLTVNALIASAWDVFNQRCRRGKDMLIYNFVSSVDGPTWNEYFFGLVDINKTFPFRSAVYLPLVTLVKYNILCRICVWFGHFLPALLVDAANICIGRSPRMWKLCMAIDKFSRVIQPFCTSVEWSYSTDNVQAMWNHLNEKDQQLFKFSMMGFDWSKYLIDCHEGIRHYLVKEDDSMLESGHIKYRRFYWIHQIAKVIFLFIAFWIIWCMLTVCINYSL